ncbi:5-hydroxytryptamine receptor 1-like [Limulus polyphemus]|uniref:5-hydroxytryptamine receptor 1-like n=1 Tax=Limulus polyphemus TaxID=6850 RepID=A0ABM1RUW4_LIMPO|nr:5-hydroxytryptamine receptor 1-like [Limulus polyphemus]
MSSSTNSTVTNIGLEWTSEDNSSSGSQDSVMLVPYSVSAFVALLVLLSFMIVATAIGNALVCISVYLVKKLRQPSNFLLVSLAVSDLCVSLLVMPFALHYELTGSWNLGPEVCDMWVAFDVTSCTASILNLCMISVDRYLAITKPLTYGVRRTSRRICLCIAAVWVLSCLISVPPLIVLGNEHGTPAEPTCEVSQNFGYQLYATLGSFYIPLMVMIFVYLKIYVAAKRVVEAEHKSLVYAQRNACRNENGYCQSQGPLLIQKVSSVSTVTEKNLLSGSNTQDPSQNTTGNLVGVGDLPRSQPQNKSSMWKERKASITLGIIMSAFTVCWLPFFVLTLLRAVDEDMFSVSPSVRSLVLWLGYINSMMNPIIYVTFHHDFRRTFKEILCLRCTTVNATMRQESAFVYYATDCVVRHPQKKSFEMVPEPLIPISVVPKKSGVTYNSHESFV